MQIWVDADACPNSIKEIIFRAAIRTKTVATLVANQPISSPISPFIKKMLVSAGFDVADAKIIETMSPGDLVITADIPLADAAIHKGGTAINPRGELYTKENIKQKLSIRNLNTQLRESGVITGGPSMLGKNDINHFANSLDKFLTANQPPKK